MLHKHIPHMHPHCTNICTHTTLHKRYYTHTRVRAHTHTHTHILHTNTYTHTYTHAYAHILHTHKHTHTRAHTYTHTRTHTHIHTNTHIYAHIQTHILNSIKTLMLHEDSNVFFFKFATARRKQILNIGFRTIAAYLHTLAHLKFNSFILKNQLPVHICMEACNNSTAAIFLNAVTMPYVTQTQQYSFANYRKWWSTTVMIIFEPHC